MKTILTLDYELFNGEVGGTVSNCIIKPTEELCKVLDKYCCKATFFVDVCFLLRLKNLQKEYDELKGDWIAVTQQLKWLASNGHDIELHIHPNWYRATYKDGIWTPYLNDYKLSDIPQTVSAAIFKEGIQLIEDITGKRPVAFRAGAYCIQTYDQYAYTFKENSIKIDSSVYRNRSSKTERWEWYDYTSIPKVYKYRFAEDVCVEDNNGGYIEVSIPSYKMNVLQYFHYKIIDRRVQQSLLQKWGDGKTSIGGTLLPWPQRILSKIKRSFMPHFVPASIDGGNVNYLELLYRRELKNGEYFLIMGHPKLLSPYSISCLDAFLNNNINTMEFVTIDTLAKNDYIYIKD